MDSEAVTEEKERVFFLETSKADKVLIKKWFINEIGRRFQISYRIDDITRKIWEGLPW